MKEYFKIVKEILFNGIGFIWLMSLLPTGFGIIPLLSFISYGAPIFISVLFWICYVGPITLGLAWVLINNHDRLSVVDTEEDSEGWPDLEGHILHKRIPTLMSVTRHE